MVREMVLKIVRAFKNRRLQRHSAIQADILSLLQDEEAGFLCDNFMLRDSKGSETAYSQATIKIEANRFLAINSQHKTKQKLIDFYEANAPLKIPLEHISCIATDFNGTVVKK